MGLVRGDPGGHDGHRIDCELPAIDFATLVRQLRRWARVESAVTRGWPVFRCALAGLYWHFVGPTTYRC
jgi:hypothetical protein